MTEKEAKKELNLYKLDSITYLEFIDEYPIVDKTTEKTLEKESKRLLAVRSAINEVENPYKKLLIEKYLKGNNLEEVADIMEKSLSYIYAMHKKAIHLYCEKRNKTTI